MWWLQSKSLESGSLVTSNFPSHWGLKQKLLLGSSCHVEGYRHLILQYRPLALDDTLS